MLTEAQIAAMRATADAALPETFTLLDKAYGEGTASGGSEGFVPTDVYACRASPMDASEAEEMGIEWTESTLRLTFSAGVPLETKHRVLFRDVEYEVRAVMDARAWQTSGRAVIDRVRKKRPT